MLNWEKVNLIRERSRAPEPGTQEGLEKNTRELSKFKITGCEDLFQLFTILINLVGHDTHFAAPSPNMTVVHYFPEIWIIETIVGHVHRSFRLAMEICVLLRRSKLFNSVQIQKNFPSQQSSSLNSKCRPDREFASLLQLYFSIINL